MPTAQACPVPPLAERIHSTLTVIMGDSTGGACGTCAMGVRAGGEFERGLGLPAAEVLVIRIRR